MSFSLFKSKKQSESFAVFCINTSSVTLTITSKTSDKSSIVHIARHGLEQADKPNPEALLRLVTKKIDLIFTEMHKNGGFKHINRDTRIIVLVGAPWQFGATSKLKIAKETKFLITEKLIMDTVRTDFDNLHKDLTIMNIELSDYRLNGYVHENPLGKSTDILEFSAYVSTVPTLVKTSVTESIATHLPHHVVEFHSYASAVNETQQRDVASE